MVRITSLVEIKNLKKRYPPAPGAKEGQLAVNGINLTIERGEIFSLLGPNGAGKTSTISMMSGLLTPTEGDVLVDGHSIIREPITVKKMIGVVPQEIALYPQLSARANLEFFGKMYGLHGPELAKRCDEVLAFIGLSDRQKERLDTYSGGMKRRVNIGVGLLHKPTLVFMDEPTVGIDPQSRRSILDAVKTLNSEGMTVLYTTHYMEEAQELSNRVGIIDHGQLIAVGNQGELMQKVGEKDTILIKIGEESSKAVEAVKSIPGIDGATADDGTLRLLAGRGRQALPAVIRALDEKGFVLQSVEVKEPNLEAVFLHLTGRALRD
ncbi:MAG TPA: ABC transporter ATP-binding protein [Aggregatilineales bacterium]|nr:ABC transporter ATP-binding protein [Aggregatilineales bacterium]